jgi:hypothetical protein
MMRYSALLTLCVTATAACSGSARTDESPAAIGDKADSAWCHLNFDSIEGTNIRVDYQLAKQDTASQSIWTANPVWVNVSNPGFDGLELVHVWIGDSAYSSKDGYAYAKQYHALTALPDVQLDLAPSEDLHRVTGAVEGGLRVSEYAFGDDQYELHAHEIAVVIDGQWQTDLTSGSHNFINPDLLSCGH